MPPSEFIERLSLNVGEHGESVERSPSGGGIHARAATEEIQNTSEVL